jgi:hypothetical protein
LSKALLQIQCKTWERVIAKQNAAFLHGAIENRNATVIWRPAFDPLR